MPALRVMWAALVDAYEQTLTLAAANLLWVVLNLPLYAVLVLLLAFVGDSAATREAGVGWPLVAAAWLLLLVPTPAAVALGGVARVAAGPDVPRVAAFWATLRQRWRLALTCFAISVVTGAALIGNAYFYAVLTTGWLRFVSILWLYGTLFWFGVHLYLVPLMLHVAKPRALDLYRRAALIVLGHPGFTLLLLLLVSLVGLISVIFLPAYALLAGAYLSLVQTRALREIRRRHGDLLEEDGG